MSVPVGKRKESGMEFLKNARDIEEIFIDIRVKKPKRYMFFYDKLLDIAFNLLSEVKAGNSIYPENKIEAGMRQRHFKEALAICQVLVSQIEVVHHKFRDEGLPIGQVQQVAEKINQEIKDSFGQIKSSYKENNKISQYIPGLDVDLQNEGKTQKQPMASGLVLYPVAPGDHPARSSGNGCLPGLSALRLSAGLRTDQRSAHAICPGDAGLRGRRDAGPDLSDRSCRGISHHAAFF